MIDKHAHNIDFAELAALYAAGALSPAEAVSFEALVAVNADAAAALRQLEPALDALTHSFPALLPSRRVHEALLDRIDAASREDAAPEAAPPHDAAAGEAGVRQVWKQWTAQSLNAELFVARASECEWQETGAPGVRVRRLFVDAPRDQFTAIVRMDAGTSYPRHIHNGAEECLVLEGELRVGETVLRAGDYQRAPAGSRHGVQSTDTGCLLLIVSSLSDEMF